MTNQSSFDSQVIYLDSEKAHILIPAIVFVIITMITGITGNISVLYFYRFRCQQTTGTFFILAIASFDLCISIFSMPVEIVDIKLFYKFDNVFVCKLDRFVTHFASISSTFLLNFIAFERHRMICNPFKNKITHMQAKLACTIIVFSSIIFSAPMTVFYDVIHVNVSYSGFPYTEGFECTTTKDESMEFYLLLTYVIHLTGFVVNACSLTLFYILIGHTLLRQRKFRILATRVARSLSVVGIRCRQPVPKAIDSSLNGDIRKDIQKGSQIPNAIEKGGRREGVKTEGSQMQDVSGNEQGPSVSDFEESKGADIASGHGVSDTGVRSVSCVVRMGPGFVTVVEQSFKHGDSLTSEIESSTIADVAHISPTLNEGDITEIMISSNDNVEADEAITTNQPLGGSLVSLPAVGGIQGIDSNSSATQIKLQVTPSVAMKDLTVETITSDTLRKSKNNRQNLMGRTTNANASTTKYTLIMFLVSACFVISFLPFLSLMVWRIYHNVQEVSQMTNYQLILYSLGIRSYFLNSAVNPLIYGLFNTEFRSFFYGIICKCMTAKSRPST